MASGSRISKSLIFCSAFISLLLVSQFYLSRPYTYHTTGDIGTVPNNKSRSAFGVPDYNIILTPLFEDEKIGAVAVSVEYQSNPELPTSSGILYGASEVANTPALDFKSGSLRASDEDGNFELSPRDASTSFLTAQEWVPSRPTRGNVTVSYIATPRYVDDQTRSGPSLDFRLEGGGFTTSAFAVLLTPSDLDNIYSINMAWNLTDAPVGTKAVWSYGEGTKVRRTLKARQLLWTYLAAGPLQSYENQDKLEDQALFNVHWFGNPPLEIEYLSSKLSDMFKYMSEFFEDDGDPYRVFLRHNPYPGTNTGTALQRSFIFCYDDSDYTAPGPFNDKLMVLTHEMVHNWIMWDIDVDMENENWYTEGWVEYYCLFFLYKLRILTGKDYVTELNNRLSSYFTNPFARNSIPDVIPHTWESTSAQRMPYRKGFAFAILLGSLIYQASNGDASLDDIALGLIRNQKRGLPSNPQQFIEILGGLLNNQDLSLELYRNVTQGHALIIPPANGLRDGRFKIPTTLRREDQETFELGFDEVAARTGSHVVKDLDPKSRAAEAGIKEGDHISTHLEAPSSELHFRKLVETAVQRPGEDHWQEVKFWPRAWDKVKSWSYQWDEEVQEPRDSSIEF